MNERFWVAKAWLHWTVKEKIIIKQKKMTIKTEIFKNELNFDSTVRLQNNWNSW